MSRQVVRYASGLPLTIKVLGSFLRGLNEREWKDALERLKTIPQQDTQKILKISYDALEPDLKDIFLDVACILKGEQKDKAIRVLESCGFYASIGLSVLEKKSLITISKYGSLGMHDRIEEMGKYIDCHSHPDEHNRHSRLWIDKEIEDILANNLINEAIRCIKLLPQRLDLRTFMTGLRNMKKVRVLYMCSGSDWDDSNVSQLFPNSLKYLCWRAYPFSSLHETFQADNLVGLDMSFSSKLQFWLVGKDKALTKLRFLDLSHTSLRRLNLGLTPNLERLDLTDCWDLVEINAPVGCLKNLLYLALSGSGRYKSFLFDKQSESLKVGSLSELHLIVESKDKCALHPYNNLPKYNFTCLYKEDQAASSFGNIEKLISIGGCACTNLESFSRSICSLKCLRKLTLEGTIPEVPKDLHHLLYLEELILSSTKIKHLPDSVCMLKQLKYLKLQGCGHLEKLPEGFGQLECLKELNITGTAISHLPQCIFGLKGVRIVGSKMMLESFGFTFEIQSSNHETFVNITGAPKQESPVHSMSSSSTLSIRKSIKYDVFLSSRGEDTRNNFVGNLYDALKKKGIKTYMHDEKIEEGKTINDQLIKSIKDSRFYIIVFSNNYASSSWCLEELAKIMECQKVTEHITYPVFYDVEPIEVSRLSGAVGQAFSKHENQEAAGKWRDAMKELADLAGWELKATTNGDESKSIQIIVDAIFKKLHSTISSADGKLVGMETRIRDVLSSLDIGTEDVRMIGIKGMGGGGKTTLAKAVYDRLSTFFEGKSFVENVREVSQPSLSGLKKLQNRILKDVLNEQDITFSSVDGKNMLKDMMSRRKTLVVLDDVDRIDQLEALAGEPDWFKAGSRSIITTRDEQLLLAHRVKFVHDVNLLSSMEAICLFSRYAFKRDIPTRGYEELSGQVVQYAHGLPLTIKVLGSFLCGQSEPYWVDAIERLKTIPLKATMDRLEISFDGLEKDYKEIFLDVACILKGWFKEDAIRALESCGFHAKVGLRVLERKSLITISESGHLRMHDHLEEMGRNIVRRLHPDEPNKHNRLWIGKEIEDILANDMGTQATKCLYFWSPGFSAGIAVKGLAKMKDLRFIYIDDRKSNVVQLCEFDNVSEYLPSSLRFMSWAGFPFSSLPNTFHGKYLVELEICFSKIVQVWEEGEGKVLHKLRFLRIWTSKLQTFDLRLAPNLEQLTIKYCDDFLKLHIPADHHSKLKYLNFNCSKLTNLQLGNTPNLKALILEGCNDLVELDNSLKLEELNLGHSKLRTLDLGLTPNLKRLNLKNCYDLVEINAPIGCLKNLVFLDLSGCGRFKSFVFDKRSQPAEACSLSELHLIAKPRYVCLLQSDNDSPKFQFSCYYKEDKASSFGNLERLISLGLCACTNLESFSRSICSLQCLRKLTLEGSITEAPRDLDQLECLEELIFSSTKIINLPDSICKLKHLKSFKIKSCWLLEKLPEDIGRLESLEKLILTDCELLQDIPNSICKMKCIKSLDLHGCIRVVKLPEDIGCLEGLKELNIVGTGITCLPQSIFRLIGLRIVGSMRLLDTHGLLLKGVRTYVADDIVCYI